MDTLTRRLPRNTDKNRARGIWIKWCCLGSGQGDYRGQQNASPERTRNAPCTHEVTRMLKVENSPGHARSISVMLKRHFPTHWRVITAVSCNLKLTSTWRCLQFIKIYVSWMFFWGLDLEKGPKQREKGSRFFKIICFGTFHVLWFLSRSQT